LLFFEIADIFAR